MKSKFQWGILSLGMILFATGCATSPNAVPVMPIVPVSVIGVASQGALTRNVFHIVGPQETLWRISKTYGIPIKTILTANHISDPKLIKSGQKLYIPGTQGATAVIPLYPTRRWTYIVVHHTATGEGDAFTIDKLHHKRGFWNGLGYHFLIDNGTEGKEDGQIQVGPRWIKQTDGAHCNADDMNQKAIGVSLVGNFSEIRVSKKELDSLVFLVKTLQRYYGIPDSRVIGHRDVRGKQTECPGKLFPWTEFKNRLRN